MNNLHKRCSSWYLAHWPTGDNPRCTRQNTLNNKVNSEKVHSFMAADNLRALCDNLRHTTSHSACLPCRSEMEGSKLASTKKEFLV